MKRKQLRRHQLVDALYVARFRAEPQQSWLLLGRHCSDTLGDQDVVVVRLYLIVQYTILGRNMKESRSVLRGKCMAVVG